MSEFKPFLQFVADDLRTKYGDELSDHVLVFPNRREILFFTEFWVGASDEPQWTPECITIQELFRSQSHYSVPDDVRLAIELYSTIIPSLRTKEEQKLFPIDETLVSGEWSMLDTFYPIAQTIISDFDDLDKSLAEAKQVFANSADLEEMRSLDYLTDEQKETLQVFLSTFDADASEERFKRFTDLWRNLSNIYAAFRHRLAQQGLAYEGMLMREVVEKLKEGEIHFEAGRHYSFVGFNVLSEAEKRLFSYLRDKNVGHFYWDYDEFYVKREPDFIHEAGLFMRENIKSYHNELRKEHFCRIGKEKKDITIVSCSTDNAQARFVSDFVRTSHADGVADRDTAIVLADESLLLPVIHSVPAKYADGCDAYMNVTMGFPLLQTPIFSLMQEMIAVARYLLQHAESQSVPMRVMDSLMAHPYVRACYVDAAREYDDLISARTFYPRRDTLASREHLAALLPLTCTDGISVVMHLKEVLRSVAKCESLSMAHDVDHGEILYSELYKEAIFRAYTTCTKLLDALSMINTKIGLGNDLALSLLVQMIRQQSVPFSGEPIKGMQVMGFLETRGLDFRNVCLLSASEGSLPPSGQAPTFIPNSIRTSFGMTTANRKTSIFAYYFYRLISRAQTITLVYNAAANDVSDGQMSRFLRQLQTDTDYDIRLLDIKVSPSISQTDSISISKTPAMIEQLLDRYDGSEGKRGKRNFLSPSALNEYIDCSFKFYLHYVLHLQMPDEEDENISPAMMGSIFHYAMEHFYTDGHAANAAYEVTREMFSPYLVGGSANARIAKLLDKAIEVMYYNDGHEEGTTDHYRHVTPSDYHGHLVVISDVLKAFLYRMLSADDSCAPFDFIAAEVEKHCSIDVSVGGETRQVYVGGIVDRIDRIGGTLRVLDYKTGHSIADDKLNNTDTYLDDMFVANDKRRSRTLQTWLYSAILHRESGEPIIPQLVHVNHALTDDSGLLRLNIGNDPYVIDSEKSDAFFARLSQVVSEIFDPSVPFSQVREEENPNACKYCDFATICKKQTK